MNIYTPEEFKKFITAVKEIAEEKEKTNNDLSEWDYYVFLNISFYTGLYKSEILDLQWSDIDGSCLTISHRISYRSKEDDFTRIPRRSLSAGKKTVQVPLPLMEILEEHKQRQQLLNNFNEDFRICNNLSDIKLQKRIDLYSSLAGLKRIRIHDFSKINKKYPA